MLGVTVQFSPYSADDLRVKTAMQSPVHVESSHRPTVHISVVSCPQPLTTSIWPTEDTAPASFPSTAIPLIFPPPVFSCHDDWCAPQITDYPPPSGPSPGPGLSLVHAALYMHASISEGPSEPFVISVLKASNSSITSVSADKIPLFYLRHCMGTTHTPTC